LSQGVKHLLLFIARYTRATSKYALNRNDSVMSKVSFLAPIRINNDVKIHILDIGSRSIKLGVEAPGNIPINRKEIYEAIKTREGI